MPNVTNIVKYSHNWRRGDERSTGRRPGSESVVEQVSAPGQPGTEGSESLGRANHLPVCPLHPMLARFWLRDFTFLKFSDYFLQENFDTWLEKFYLSLCWQVFFMPDGIVSV